MSERVFPRRENPQELEYLDESELESVLEPICSYIGRIIVELNSLEDLIDFCVKEIVSNSETNDDKLYVFLSEMRFSSKARALVNLYGQLIGKLALTDLSAPLAALDAGFREAAKRRNQYAHGNWGGISTDRYVCVKTTAKKTGVFQVFRRFYEPTMSTDLEYIRCITHQLIEFDERINERML